MDKKEALRNNVELRVQIQGLISQTALVLSTRTDKQLITVNAVIQSGMYRAKRFSIRTEQLLTDTAGMV